VQKEEEKVAEVPAKPFFGRVTEVFTFLELMPFMRGEFDKAENFCARTKLVLRNEMGGEDSAEARAAYCQTVESKVRDSMHVPEACREFLHGNDSPVDKVMAVFPGHVKSLVDGMLNF